jgi:hypothetical protein
MLSLVEPYESRRRRLERIVLPITGYSMLAEKILINFDDPLALIVSLMIVLSAQPTIYLRGINESFRCFEGGLQK